MRLIKLSANQSSFKTIKFNATGLSLIVGVRSDNLVNAEKPHEDGLSYNGVGKSLIVELIHFCLGSSKNNAFEQHLSDWEFSLEFETFGQHYIAARQTSKQAEISLNGQSLKIAAFNTKLEKLLFNIPENGIAHLTFRSLLPRFIRRSNQDYNDPKTTTGDKESYTTLLRNLFLLGLDIELVQNKYLLRKKQSEIQDFEKNFKKDPFIREYYTGNKDASLQTKYLEEQIFRLDADLASFQVAEDFYEIEQEANQLNKELKDLKNQKVILENGLQNIEKSFQNKPDISREKILQVYQDLLLAFKVETIKRLEDVESFHKQLIQNRFARLGQERIKLNVELVKTSSNIKNLNDAVNTKLAYLSNKRALDQYVAVSGQRAEFSAKLQKLQDYQKLLTKSRDDLVRVQKSLTEETIKTNVYLAETQTERQENLELFSQFSKQFYPSSPSGITIYNNVGENKTRYDFDVRIEADGSDGINAVKIFCYDFAVLLMKHNHNIDFIFHDSRLFSDIDPRQRSTLFKIASEHTLKRGLQYIATVNQDQIDGMKSEFKNEEYTELFEVKNIVLTLKDDGSNSKLLGIQVDMHYLK